MRTVTVLMSTYNGEKYLREQIESLILQKDVKVNILVRDDGSIDTTKDILEKYQSEGVLTWYRGENLRSAKSFMDLIKNAPESEYYAFCDQDDVWNNNKLAIATTKLIEIEDGESACLYCSNYQLVDENLNNLPDNGHITTTTFTAALVSSCCTGCTTVFNWALLKILQKEIPDIIVMHDDWAHKVCLAVGGKVYYDNKKTLKYRQHGNNVDGGRRSTIKKISGIYDRLKSKKCIRSNQISELVRIYSKYMTEDKIRAAKFVADYKSLTLVARIRIAFFSGIKSPYKKMNRGFRAAILLKYY